MMIRTDKALCRARRALLLAVSPLLMTGCASSHAPLQLAWQARPQQGQMHYQVQADLRLPPGLRIALDQGLQLKLRFAARQVETGHWYTQVERKHEQALALRYSALTRHYQLQHDKGWLSLAEWQDVQQELSRQQWQWPLSDSSTGRVHTEVRWWLDGNSLPPSLRLQAWHDPAWKFDTGWQVLHGE